MSNFTEENYNEIIKLNSEEMFDEALKLYNIFYQKYKNIFNEYNENFKNDCKICMSLLLKNYKLSLEDSENSEDEIDNFLTIINNIEYILSNLNEIDLKNIDNDFKEALLFIFNYFNENNSENSIYLSDLLKDQNEIKEILDNIKENKTSEDLVKYKLFCSNKLKKFEKNDVLKVIEDSLNKNDNYENFISNSNDLKLNKEYLKYIVINSLINLSSYINSII
jgi:Asp-tRNA(Asn)/Glu-tRNA(Gln) amidotransferase C subunit